MSHDECESPTPQRSTRSVSDAAQLEALQRALPTSVTDAVVSTDLAYRVRTWNPGAEALYGWTAAEAAGRILWELISPHPRGVAEEEVQTRVRHEARWQGELTHRTKAGRLLAIFGTVEVLRDERGEPIGTLVINRDIGARKQAEEALQASELRLRMALDGAKLGVWHRDFVTGTMTFDARCRELFGMPAEGPVPEMMERVHPDDRKRVETAIGRALDPRDPNDDYLIEHRLLLAGGEERWLAVRGRSHFRRDGQERVPVFLSGVVADVSERRALDEQLTRLAHYDPLTGLPNRTLLHDRLAQAIANARRHASPLAVLYLDVDDFKRLNDSLGHAFGDRVLQRVAKRLTSVLRGGDTVARLGGDEFVLVLSELGNASDAARVASKILAQVAKPETIEGREVHIETSIGIALYQGQETLDDLLQQADLAMYRAKAQGKGRYRFFTPELHRAAQQRLIIEGDLRRALRSGEFVLYYQPRVDLVTREITGLEALVRWRHPRRGLLPPGSFIPIAEETGLIHDLGGLVLEEACRQLVAWRAADVRVPPVAVNLSVMQLQREGFVDMVADLLERTGLDPHLLEMEITESIMMELAGGSAAALTALRQLGIRILIDDFGTGYSSLAYVRRLPLDGLKIDRTFLKGVDAENTDSKDAAIVRAIITLGRNLGLRLVAEGIDRPAQLQFLLDAGCPEGQGFLIAPPRPAAEVEALLRPSKGEASG